MERKAFLIYNPRAGRGLITQHLSDVIDLLVKGGYTVEVYPTQSSGDAVRKIASLKDGFTMVVAAGGDGTLDEVVTGMLESGKALPIGYIPVGSTNDYASTLHLPTSPAEAAGCILDGQPCAVDMGSFNEDVFIYVAAFGAFTEVSYSTDQELKNTFGHLAYLMEGALHLADIRPCGASVFHDGRWIEGDFIYGMISNTTSVGGSKPPQLKEARLSDGEFEVTLIRMPRNPADLSEIASALVLGNESPLVECFKASELKMVFDRKVAWTLDGEFGGEVDEVDFKTLHEVAHLILMDPEKLPL